MISRSLSGLLSPRATDPNTAACRIPRARRSLSWRELLERSLFNSIINMLCVGRAFPISAYFQDRMASAAGGADRTETNDLRHRRRHPEILALGRFRDRAARRPRAR